jgi:RNA polymerase sigma factor (TIGR02999 family)
MELSRSDLDSTRPATQTADELLPMVYSELRRLAARQLSRERPGQTLGATALVHEAYLRLTKQVGGPGWNDSAHFFRAAAEAMRRILIEAARRKKRLKRGGDGERFELLESGIQVARPPEELLAVDEALDKLAHEDEAAAEIVKLKYFVGLSIEEAADALGMARATAYRHWKFARAWLRCEMSDRE